MLRMNTALEEDLSVQIRTQAQTCNQFLNKIYLKNNKVKYLYKTNFNAIFYT